MKRAVPGTQQVASSSSGGALRFVWLAIILIVGVMVGAAAGLLLFASGARGVTAVLTGGGTFAGTVMLLLTLGTFAQGKSG
jgi:hypothetical protein